MRKLLFVLALLLQAWSWRASAASDVIISEFMAINDSTLADEDGAYSDWIELYNSSTNIVNLGGWYLSNKATNLTQWSFPSTNLGPSSFLIVFASNKNRRVPGAPLHTSFKLSGSGEYLALVLPDGVTKASEFNPFPQQYADISYGYMMTGIVTSLVNATAPAKALVPSSDIGPGWRFVGFNDGSWTAGVLGAGFDLLGNYTSAIGLDLRSRMFNVNGSAYLRVPFSADNPSGLNSMTLSMRYDDGFVAYLNGTEVLRRNAPATPAWNSTATAAHGAPTPGALNESFEGSGTNYTLTLYGAGSVPAVQPAAPGSTGNFLRLLYDGVNSAANTATFRQTASGLYDSIVADFDFRISSAVNNPADGFAFMLIPTSLYGTNGPGVNITAQAVEKPNYPGVFGIGFSVYPHTLVNDVSAHWNGTQVADTSIPISTIDLAAGVFHHAKVTLQHVSGGARVTVTLTPNINGIPGVVYSPITNLFISGLNPFSSRVQFGGRTGGLNLGLDLDNCNVQFLPPQGPIAFEDFDISSSLGLLNPGTNLLAVQGLNVTAGNSNFLAQPNLVGRSFGIAGSVTYLYPATPGSWNNSVGSMSPPSAVSFQPPAGVYASNVVQVTLSSDNSSAVIRYTLDGSTPGTNSPIFTSALTLSTNATIRAQATLSGIPGPVSAANYVLLDPAITNFNSNLPLVIIDTLGQTILDGTKIGAYAVFIDTNTASGRTYLTSPANYAGRLGIGLHGSSSLGFPKQPYTIELDDENGDALDFPLLGQPAGSDWLLYPSYDDKTFMNNVMTEELFAAMGHYAVRCKYTEMFLRTTPGKLTAGDYVGIYILIERIRVAPNRVAIHEMSSADNLPPAVTGGYLFSKDRVAPGDLTITTASGQQLLVLSPKPDKITQPQLDYFTGYLNDFENALYGPNWLNPLTGYAAYIDLGSFVDQHWIVEYSKNIDGYRLSNYMNKDREGKLKMEPIWDWDLSWGNANYADGGHTNGWYYTQMDDSSDIWLHKLRTDPDFYQQIVDRWAALRLNIFNATNLLSRINQITNLLWEAQARDFARWPRLGTYVWPNPDGAAGGWDVDYVNPTTYDGIISQFKKYVLGRYLWVDQQFVPAPVLATNGATVSMSAPFGAIYYTLDNTDPRASGGAVSSAAHPYTGTVTLTNNAGVVARAFYNNAWSGPARALYIATMPSLRITEINYHPAPPPAGSPYQAKDFEFVEIQNTGSNVINLAGVRLGGGINFTFAPSQFAPAGGNTWNDFEGTFGETPFSPVTLGQPPSPYLTNDGPAGNLLCLLNSNTNTARNRIAFDQTAAGAYDRLVADFDFRASTRPPPGTNGAPTTQDFDSAGTSYTLSNSGSVAPALMSPDSGSSGNFLRLVPSSGGQLGVVAFNRSAIGAFNTVVATFDFRITPPAGAIPADGFGFALLSTAAYGTGGAGPFFSEEPSLTSSIGVGFDVYANASTAREPNGNHVSLHWNSAQIGNAAIPTFNMANGKFNRAQIIVQFSGGNAYVTVRLTPDINGTPGRTETVFQNALIAGAAPYQSRVALGARTGGLWASHDVDNINVQYLSNAAAAGGLSLLLLPAAQFGTSGPGSTLMYFSDLPLVNNTFSVDLSFNASNLVNDVALYWNAGLVTALTLPPSTLDLDAGVFHHGRLELNARDTGGYASLSLTPNSLLTPGAPVNIVSNLFVPGLDFANSRLEFAARNGGTYARLDVENVLASYTKLVPLLLNPGESILVVHNLAAFVSRYGSGFRVAGEFSGSLADEGDRLSLFGPVGEPILDFSYNPAWYPITDGGGFSLVAVDPNAAADQWGLQQNWRASSQLGGSPGGDDPPPPAAFLNISEPFGNSVWLSWPASAGTFALFTTTSLAPPVSWVGVTNGPSLVGNQWLLSLPVSNAASFYRLQGQAPVP